jgi:hypothetical protein
MVVCLILTVVNRVRKGLQETGGTATRTENEHAPL